MTEEERLHIITEQLIIVRDNLFRGMSKSIQKLQAKSINEVLGLDNFIESPKPVWVSLTDDDLSELYNLKYADYLSDSIGIVDFILIAGVVDAALRKKNDPTTN